MTTDTATLPVESTSDEPWFRIPSGYERCFGANWIMIRRKESTHE